ncbi:MAG: putative MPP superfamily phosphohydrolase [Bradymonadia bacterium]|jgi:predicted MPP superfamily phosphohydrolase
MLSFFATVSIIWFGAHAYLGSALASAFSLATLPAVGAACVGGAAALAGLIYGRGTVRGARWIAMWLAFVHMGLLATTFVFVVVAQLLAAALSLVLGDAALPLVQLAFFSAFFVSMVSLAVGAQAAEVKRVEVPCDDLHPDLQGYRIAVLADLHVGGPTTRRQFEAVVDQVLALDADLIAFAGDLVDGSVEVLAKEVTALERLRARDGAYFVTGNHEYYSNSKRWEEVVASHGVTVLNNTHRVVSVGDARLLVAGVTDTTAYQFIPNDRSDPHAARAGSPRCDFDLLLAHQPASILDAARAGYDLQVSGHTHGGQFFPFTLLVGLFNMYSRGLNRHDSTWIYVTKGSATWGPPMRLGARTEVTLLTLQQAPQA